MWRGLWKVPRRLISTNIPKYVSMPQERIGTGKLEVQMCVMCNGLIIGCTKTTYDDTNTMASVSVVYASGSRYEYCDMIGASHFLRHLAGGNGCAFTGFAKGQYLQQWAGAATCAGDRDVIIYTMTCPPPVFKTLRPFFMDACSRTIYTEANIDDVRSRVRDDLHAMHPGTRVMDLIQKASWGGALYNSAFCPEGRIDEMDAEKVNKFAGLNIRPENCAVAGTGIPYEYVRDLADGLNFGEKVERCEMCFRHRPGFETYDLGPKADTYVAIAVPSTGSCNFRRVVVFNILAHALGTGNMIEFGQREDSVGELPLSLLSADTCPAHISAFNISYRDAGIFGIVAKTHYQSARCIALRISQCMANMAGIDTCLFEIGKKRLILKLVLNDEKAQNISEGLALFSLNGCCFDGYNGTPSLIKMIKEISPQELCAAAKEIANNHRCLSYAVVGDVCSAPLDDEVRFI